MLPEPSGLARRRTARAAASVAVAIGQLRLAGWLLDLHVLTGVRAGWVEMRPITAAALLCVGTAVWAQTMSGRRWLGIGLAALGAASAALTLGEWLLGRDLGIDLLLFRSQVLSGDSGAPGRMAGPTAVCLLLEAAASAASGARGAATRRLAEASGVLSGLIAGLVLLAYVYGEVPAEIGRHVPMAANTALACLALAVAAVVALPESALVRAFDPRPPGGLTLTASPPSCPTF